MSAIVSPDLFSFEVHPSCGDRGGDGTTMRFENVCKFVHRFTATPVSLQCQAGYVRLDSPPAV